MNQCPICKIELANKLPDFCNQCGWELRSDLTLVPSLDLPDEAIEDYKQRLSIAQRVWRERTDAIQKQKELEEKLKKQDELEAKLKRLEAMVSNAQQAPPVQPEEKPPNEQLAMPEAKNGYSEDTPVPELTRDTFETLDEFKQRLEDHPPIPAGKATFIKEQYNIETGDFPVRVEWASWADKLKGELFGEKLSVRAERNLAREICGMSPNPTVYARISAEGETVYMRSAEIAASNSALTLESSRARNIGENEWIEPVAGIVFVRVPGGKFQMGDTFGKDESYLKSVHEVELDEFSIGKYPVTQGQWKAVMGGDPSKLKKGDDYPVEMVSYDDAQRFITALNEMTGNRYNFYLPSEAQWEYAARSGGKKELYAGGGDVDSLAWYNDNSGKEKHQIGQKQPNKLGLYDMSGNVWEWCRDIYSDHAYSNHAKKNPVFESGGSYRVLRGGSWCVDQMCVCCAYREYFLPSGRRDDIGFRLASA